MDADRNTLLDLIAVINANRRCLESAALKSGGTAEKTHYRNQVRQQVAAVSRIRRDLARSDKQRAALPSRQVETYVDSLSLVQLGTAPDGTFWSGYMFDHTISHGLHNQVMGDIDAKFGMQADATTHKILNQAMFDVAQALGKKDVKLAAFH